MNGFSHIFPMTVRARDIDAWGHVNNAVYFTYLESARLDYLLNVALQDATAARRAMSTILAHVMCQYEKPIGFGQEVWIGTRVLRIGNTSVTFQHRIEADGQLAATAQAVSVYFDYDKGQPKRVPDDFRQRVEDFEARGRGAGE